MDTWQIACEVYTQCFNHVVTLNWQNVMKKRDQVQAEYEAKLEAVAFREEKRTTVSIIFLIIMYDTVRSKK